MVPAILAFVMTFAVILGAYWLFEARPAGAARARLRLRLGAPAPVESTPVLLVKSRLAPGAAAPRGLTALPARLARAMRASGVDNAPRVVIRTLTTVVVVCTMALVVGAPATVIAGLAIVTSGIPVVLLRRRHQQRLNAIEETFPQAIELLGRALRAGHAFSSACAMVAEELPEPTAGEFRIICEQQNFGMAVPDVLREFAERAPLMDVRFFVTAVLTQRETGGNLSQVLDNLAAVMRDRFRVNRQLQVLTAQGRMTGWVLGVFPIALGAVLMYWAPTQLDVLLHDQTGQRMLMAAVTLQLAGLFLIRRIIRVEY